MVLSDKELRRKLDPSLAIFSADVGAIQPVGLVTPEVAKEAPLDIDALIEARNQAGISAIKDDVLRIANSPTDALSLEDAARLAYAQIFQPLEAYGTTDAERARLAEIANAPSIFHGQALQLNAQVPVAESSPPWMAEQGPVGGEFSYQSEYTPAQTPAFDLHFFQDARQNLRNPDLFPQEFNQFLKEKAVQQGEYAKIIQPQGGGGGGSTDDLFDQLAFSAASWGFSSLVGLPPGVMTVVEVVSNIIEDFFDSIF